MPASFVEDAFLFLLYTFSFFVKNQVFIGVWVNIKVLDSIPLVNLSLLMSLPSGFHYCSCIIKFDIWDGEVSESSFIVEDCFGYFGVFCFVLFCLLFHMKLNIVLSRSVKKCAGESKERDTLIEGAIREASEKHGTRKSPRNPQV